MKKRIELELEIGDSGIGFVEPLSASGRLRCRVFTEGRAVPLVEIDGNAEGLVWLATKLLAVASSSPSGYHVHVDETDGLTGGCDLILGQVKLG